MIQDAYINIIQKNLEINSSGFKNFPLDYGERNFG